MKNKIYITLITSCFVLCGCASTNKLSHTVWLNITPVEKAGVKGNVLTSVYFGDKNTVSFYTAVEKDNVIIVKPVLSASGSYNVKGNLRKGMELTAEMTNVENEPLLYKGYLATEGMVLVSPNSTAKGFSIITDITIK